MKLFNADPLKLTQKDYADAAKNHWEEARAGLRNRLNWWADHITDREHMGHRIFLIDGEDYVCIQGMKKGIIMRFKSLKYIAGKEYITIDTTKL